MRGQLNIYEKQEYNEKEQEEDRVKRIRHNSLVRSCKRKETTWNLAITPNKVAQISLVRVSIHLAGVA